MFSSSTASDAEKYPISLEFELSLSESVAVSFAIQLCVVFSKKEYTTFKIFKIKKDVFSSCHERICAPMLYH